MKAALAATFLSWSAVAFLSLARSSYWQQHLENFSPNTLSLLFFAFFIAAVSYPFVPCSSGGWGRVIWILLACVPPLMSRDVAGYLIGGANFLGRVNPHLTPLSEGGSRWLPEVADIWWLRETTFYGPVFTLMTAPFGALPLSLTSAALVFKASLTIAALILLGPGSVLLFFNPAILLNGPFDGHGDLLIAGLLVAALRYDRYRGALLGIALGLKPPLVILLPILFTNGWRRGLMQLAATIGVFAASLIVVNVSPLMLLEKVREFSSLGCFYSCTPATLLKNILPTYGLYVLIGAGLFALLVPLLRGRISEDRYIWVSLFAVPWLVSEWFPPWYLVLPIVFAIRDYERSNERFARAASYTLTGYSLLHFFGI